VGATPFKNLSRFEELCGENGIENIILITTMWDQVDEDIGSDREAEFKSDYWKPTIARHSSIGRFTGTRDSAFRLIAPILDKANNRNTHLLQELVDHEQTLSNTRAGQKLRSEIEKLVQQQQELIHKIQEELESPNNDKSLRSLMEQCETLKKISGSGSEALQRQMADLQTPLGSKLMNTFNNTFGLKLGRCVNKSQYLALILIRILVLPVEGAPM